MTKEDIIAMARECGIPSGELYHPNLERFGAIVIASEREACAKVCEALWFIDGQVTANEFAAELRARGQS